MKSLRLFLLLFLGFWILIMVFCPVFINSHQLKLAFQLYHDSPNDRTRQEFAAAHRSENRKTAAIQAIMASILAATICGFIRIGRPPATPATPENL